MRKNTAATKALVRKALHSQKKSKPVKGICSRAGIPKQVVAQDEGCCLSWVLEGGVLEAMVRSLTDFFALRWYLQQYSLLIL